MTDQQRVTDEQLTRWEWWIGRGFQPPVGVHLPGLIADLRASRARQAELPADRELLRDHHVECEQTSEDLCAQIDSLRAELVGLQQRIDKALADIEDGEHATAGRDYGRGLAHAARLVRVALTGTETDHG